MKGKITLLTIMIVAFGWNLRAQYTPELIQNINEFNLGSYPDDLIIINHKLFFTAKDQDHGYELRVYDGSPEKPGGVSLVKDITLADDPAYNEYSGSDITNIVDVDGVAYFIVRGGGLWKSDGTEAGTQLVSQFTSHTIMADRLMTNVNGTLYFIAGTPSSSALWKSDGTKDGTLFLHAIDPDHYGDGFEITEMIALNDLLIFVAEGSAGNTELWVSNSTSEGTFMLKEIKEGLDGSYPKGLTYHNGLIFFSADDGVNGRELWRTDGTPEGTQMAFDLEAGQWGSNPEQITSVNGNLYFSGNHDNLGGQLFKSDGTLRGTEFIEIKPEYKDPFYEPYPRNFVNLNGQVAFSAENSSTNSRDLWITNGISDGTHLIKQPAYSNRFYQPEEMVSDGANLFFRARSSSEGSELWISNGTDLGTLRMKDIYPGEKGSNPHNLILMGNGVFFAAEDDVFGVELWRSNLFTEAQLSVSENKINKNAAVIYPNPTSDVIKVKIDLKLVGSDYSITNLAGQTVLTGKLNSEITNIDINKLAGGLYLYKIAGEKGDGFKFLKK
ncbi:ELWxxDGT repeat protein [Flavobacterium aquicola]|uniref:Putative secreted protein (Por secretion system target) n=1 Tax=Flavobacterium aquicola TaxID=1682742 RepID=A0A3E0ETU8_9FLAO|nr:ELWxxDGT repeat protein [Flavobacterium aquicola]REH01623.1 putative secreted protein (Por secretion system target) [Flavobacterium aquicola]